MKNFYHLLIALFVMSCARPEISYNNATACIVEEIVKNRELADFGDTKSTPPLYLGVKENKHLYALVLRGRNWCGSGGCTLLILEQENDQISLYEMMPNISFPITRIYDPNTQTVDLRVTKRDLFGHSEETFLSASKDQDPRYHLELYLRIEEPENFVSLCEASNQLQSVGVERGHAPASCPFRSDLNACRSAS